MPVLVDGNNVMYRLPVDLRNRSGLRRRALAIARARRMKLEVVFDGPPPQGSPEVERLGSLTITYSGARSADELIAARIPRGGAARSWTVVTADRELARRVRSAGASVEDPMIFLRRTAPGEQVADKPESLSPEELSEWLQAFGAHDE